MICFYLKQLVNLCSEGGEQDRATRTPYLLKRRRFRVLTWFVVHETWIIKIPRFSLVHVYLVHWVILK